MNQSHAYTLFFCLFFFFPFTTYINTKHVFLLTKWLFLTKLCTTRILHLFWKFPQTLRHILYCTLHGNASILQNCAGEICSLQGVEIFKCFIQLFLVFKWVKLPSIPSFLWKFKWIVPPYQLHLFGIILFTVCNCSQYLQYHHSPILL